MLWSFIHSKSLCSTSLSLLHIGRWTVVEKNKWCWVVSSYIMMPSLRWALRCSWHQSYCANRCFPTLQNEYAHFPPNLLHRILQSSLSPQDCVSTLLRNQNQWDRNIFIFAVKWPLRLPASVFIFLAFVLLLWVEGPCSYPKLINFPLVLGIPSLSFSRMLLLHWYPSLLRHWFPLLFWIIPTCIQTFSCISWPHIPLHLLIPFFSALIHSTNSWVVL